MTSADAAADLSAVGNNVRIMCCSHNISAGLANVSGHDSTRPLPASH